MTFTKEQLEDFEYFRTMFKRRMGEADEKKPVEAKIIESYRGVLPDELLTYWENDGWTSYSKGLFWLVNPVDYDEIIQEYLASTPLNGRQNLYVIARSAFGKLSVWQQTKGNVVDISLVDNMIGLNATEDRQVLTLEEEEVEMNGFVGVKYNKSGEQNDSSGKPLFERCLKKFGQLKSNEMYGYKLNPALGGKDSITNMDKVDLFIYADIQRELEAPDYWISDTENNTITYS